MNLVIALGIGLLLAIMCINFTKWAYLIGNVIFVITLTNVSSIEAKNKSIYLFAETILNMFSWLVELNLCL